MTRIVPPLLSCLALVCACAPMPEVDAVLGPDPAGSDYPALLPIGDLSALEGAVPEEEIEANAALEERADALRTRAAGL